MSEQAPEVFDPAEHTVPEVLEHIATAHPDEIRRVLEDEAAGKARVTILNSTPAVVAVDTEPGTVEDLLGDDNPYELIRAKDATTGAEYTTSRVAALNAGSTVLDKPAIDQFGLPYPTKTVLDLRAETPPTAADADRQPGNDSEE